MAVVPFLGDSEIDIDEILAQSEARLAAKDKAVVPLPKLEVTTTAAHVQEQQPPTEPNNGGQQSQLALRVPKLKQKKEKVGYRQWFPTQSSLMKIYPNTNDA